MERVCSNQHTINDDSLKACPRCGSRLPPAPVQDVPAGPALDVSGLVSRAPRGLPLLVGGVILGLFGSLLSYAAHHGPAEFFGNVLLGLGAVLLLIGAVALGVKLGVEDARTD